MSHHGGALDQPRPIRRAPVDTSGGRASTEREFKTALGIVRRSGVVAVLSKRLDSSVGRPRALSLEGLLVAAQLNALSRHHQAHLAEVARTLNAMTESQRCTLGIRRWKPMEAYDRVEYLFIRPPCPPCPVGRCSWRGHADRSLRAPGPDVANADG